MATKSGNKGRYICKVGFYDIYAKDSLKPKTATKAATDTASSNETAAKLDTAAVSNDAEPRKLSDLFKNTRLQFF